MVLTSFKYVLTNSNYKSCSFDKSLIVANSDNVETNINLTIQCLILLAFYILTKKLEKTNFTFFQL
jgi:hypothetical protein